MGLGSCADVTNSLRLSWVHMGCQAAEEDEPKPAPKPKNPLDLLPPSTMILDSWKRLYSNSPASNFRETCIAGLWKGGDIPNSPNKEVRSLSHCISGTL